MYIQGWDSSTKMEDIVYIYICMYTWYTLYLSLSQHTGHNPAASSASMDFKRPLRLLLFFFLFHSTLFFFPLSPYYIFSLHYFFFIFLLLFHRASEKYHKYHHVNVRAQPRYTSRDSTWNSYSLVLSCFFFSLF